MTEKKIAWRRLEGKYAWIGVRGRITFFTLQFSPQHPDAWDNVGIEYADLPFKLIHHMDSRRVEDLTPMKLAEAKVHAERELDNWLAKAGLVEPDPPTPANKAIESARAIVDASVEDGVTSLSNSDHQDRLATRIAFYVTASVMDELAQLRMKALDDDEAATVTRLSERRAELGEIFSDLAEILR